MACLAVTVVFAFVYFFIAFALARKQQVYVVPFTGAALFFWHDLSFVLFYDKWFSVYDHWWLKMWWFALVGTVSTIVMLLSETAAFVQVAPVFHSPVYLGFVAALVLWPLANVWLILRLPAIAPARVTASTRPVTA